MVLLTTSISPIKLTFIVVILSINSRIVCYLHTISIFPSSSIIISFASGIIILFCYCSIITNHERKNSSRNIKIIATEVLILVTIRGIAETRESLSSSIRKRTLRVSSPFIITAMVVLLITMVCINKRIFSPKKSLSLSY